MYKKFIKPGFDYFISTCVVLGLLPVLIFFSALGLVIFKESPFFFQKRIGINGKSFIIYKLKSFKNSHVNKYGNFLRKYSIDEIPQFFNVLFGKMSIIGPRPLLPEYTALYNSVQIQRLLVKPGITGWAQIQGRNGLDWNAKFRYDVWYVTNICFLLDIKILVGTLISMFDAKCTEPSQPFVKTCAD